VCNVQLGELFLLHVDAVRAQGLPVPLPSYRRSPVDRAATELVGVEATCPEVVRLGSVLARAAAGGGSVGWASGTRAAYFGWRSAEGRQVQRELKAEGGDGGAEAGLYLQLGWLDGVGVYRGGTAAARLAAWETEERVQAFDHLPIRAVVSVECAGGPPLRVWLCAVKLDHRHPTAAALEALLYGSPGASAEDADVVALSFTDLLVTEDNVEGLRRMLRRALRRAEEYVFNEDDDGLVLRNIPAQLVRATDAGQRFASLSVAVHRRNVQVCVYGVANMSKLSWFVWTGLHGLDMSKQSQTKLLFNRISSKWTKSQSARPPRPGWPREARRRQGACARRAVGGIWHGARKIPRI
jgi:hypothetical protein